MNYRRAVVLLAVPILALGGCGSEKAPEDDPLPEFELGFEAAPDLGSDQVHLTNSGQSRLKLSIATAADGDVTVGAGPSGGQVARFPALHRGKEPPLAAVVVSAFDEEPDVLYPGARSFRFGAKFALDARSDGTNVDNGDNLMQFGYFNDPAQYKLQVDKGRPSCRIKGDAGVAFVKAETPVDRLVWYSVTCAKDGDRVTLVVDSLDGDHHEEVSTQADVGAVEGRETDTSWVTIGGKADSRGRMVTSDSDQFNGLVDDVFLLID